MENNIGWQLTESSVIGNTYIDGSTEIFKSGKWAFLTREVIQNSLDALREDKENLIINISLDDIPTKSIPDKENILKHLNGTLSIQDLPERCMKFTKNAVKLLNEDMIRVLKISDYNTKGITGSDKENGKAKSAWNALIYDEGNTVKENDNSTGSFGTGKNAPFALSGLNTVFYVTKDINNLYACEGVAKLFTSYIDGKKIDRKIYYAKKGINGNLLALDYKDSTECLSKDFLRSETGSDVIILGVDFDKEQTKKEMIQAVVENFFVILYDGKLEIKVFDEEINSKTLWNVIDKYCDKPIEYTNSNVKYGYIRQYLNVYSGVYDVVQYDEEVPGAGKLKLLISKGNDITGKWVAMFRINGMKIFDNNIRTAQQNYSAIFFPGDKDVDIFLKSIENPTHDFFDTDRIDDLSERRLAAQRYNIITKWIKNKIEKYTEILISDNDYLEGMEEYIQLDDSETESNAVNNPDVEITNFESKQSINNTWIEGQTKAGQGGGQGFGKENNKKNKKGKREATDEPGNEGKGLIKDYHNSFKFSPKITSKDDRIKIAFALDDYDSEKFNIEIVSIGEDNSASDYIPKIVEAIDEENNKQLKIDGNKIIDIDTAETNVVSIQFGRKFESRFKINVYRLRGESDES